MLAVVAGIAVATLLSLYIVYKPPAFVISHFARRWPDVLWHVPTTQPLVALTIDDAPSPHTHELLQILADHGAKATLFVIGSAATGREQSLRLAVERGHELANHAMFDEPSRSLAPAELASQIRAVQALIERTYADAGREPPPLYFRPGSGFFSTAMRGVVSGLGYRLVLGDVYPHDPQIPFARLNASHVLSMVRPGSIIICHDGRSWTAPMLTAVLPELARRGFRVVTLTELLREA